MSNRPSERVRLRDVGHRWGYRERLAAVLVLFLIGYGAVYAEVIADAVAGSRSPLPALTPVLAVLIASGYRRPPRGVTDNESDWLVVAVLGTIGFTGVTLLSTRFETLAELWRLDWLSAVLFTACTAVILLGARHAQRMWPLWVFTAVAGTPVPFSLLVGALGGSDTAVATVSVCFGATAVYLAATQAPWRRRLLAAAVSLAAGLSLVAVLLGTFSLFTTVAVAAGAVPVLVTVGLQHWIHRGANRSIPPQDYPARSWRSLSALLLLAVATAFLQNPVPQSPEPAAARGDWAQRAGLDDPREFPAVQRFLGEDATAVRYSVPDTPGLPAAAVDVITTPSLAALRDLDDVVWYPASRPLDYTDARNRMPTAPLEIREIYSNADTATDDTTPYWYALTWQWHTDAGYQQVTVVVDQQFAGAAAPPPAPEPMTAHDALVSPALWIGRQQADSEGQVDDLVIRRATEIAGSLIAGASPDA